MVETGTIEYFATTNHDVHGIFGEFRGMNCEPMSPFVAMKLGESGLREIAKKRADQSFK